MVVDKKSAKAASSGAGAKDAPAPTATEGSMVCRSFAKNKTCPRGSKCRFEHPGAAPGRIPLPLLALDVTLTAHELEEFSAIAKEHGYSVTNGKDQSPHAFARSMRTLGTRVLAESRGKKLEIQGRIRRADRPRDAFTRDVHRGVVSADDDDDVCPPDCEHLKRLESGQYDTVFWVDTQVEPEVIARYLEYPGVRQCKGLYHLHTSDGTRGGQTAVWRPYPIEEDEAYAHHKPLEMPGLAANGHIGQYMIDVEGRATSVEGDNAWLIMQRPIYGVKPEIERRIGDLAIVRFTRTAIGTGELEATAVPNIMTYVGRGTAPAYVQSSHCGKRYRMARYSDELIILEDDQGWFSTNGSSVRTARGLIVGRAISEDLRRSVEKNLSRLDATSECGRLAALLLDLEVHAQYRSQEAWDLSSATSWLARVPFAWVFFDVSRRAAAVELLARTKRATSYHRKCFTLFALLLTCLVAIIPWPYHHCDTHMGFGMTKSNFRQDVDVPVFGKLALNADYYHPTLAVTSCSIVFAMGGLDLLPRALMFFLAANRIPGMAYAAPVGDALRASYNNDRFAEQDFEGSLPLKYALPGYVSKSVLKPLGEDCEIKIRDPDRNPDDEYPRDSLWAVGVVFAGYLPSVSLPCQQNLIVAARNRQLAAMPVPDEKLFWHYAHQYLAGIAPDYDAPRPNYDAWNARFPLARRAQHDAARARLANATPTDFEINLREVFVKVEKIIRFEKGEFDPRVITGASAEFNVIFGPYFYAATDQLKKALENQEGNVYLAGGDNSAMLGEWFARATDEGIGRAICGDDQLIVVSHGGELFFIEIDGSRHDAHMHSEFVKLKWLLYHMVFGDIPHDVERHAENASALTLARARGFGVSWKHPWRTRSGDPDTTKGNSVQTDFLAKVASDHVRSLLASGHRIPAIEQALTELMFKLGYEITVKITRDSSEVTFLSGFFLPVDGKYYWAPLPGRQLAKIGWSIRNVPVHRMWRDYAGVLNSYRDFSFIPFLRAYVDVVSQLVPLEYRMEQPSKRWLVGPGVTPSAPSDDTWSAFYARYGLSQKDELDFKNALLAIRGAPYILNSSSVKKMMEVDLA
jgi:hypothetical protein